MTDEFNLDNATLVTREDFEYYLKSDAFSSLPIKLFDREDKDSNFYKICAILKNGAKIYYILKEPK